MTHLDLFSGIGGFALATGRAGFTTIGFSEIEPYACKVLKRHWPAVPNFGDIRNVRGVHADLVTGGFPCQPFSLAGQQRGAADDRHLWPEMRRVIDEARPAWVLAENVPGIIGMELDAVLSDLENIGYACWPVVVPACAVDARHRRDRVWIVAYAERVRRGESTGNTDPAQGALPETEREESAVRIGPSGKAVADPAQRRIRCGKPSRQTGQPTLGGEAVADGFSQRLEKQCEQHAREEFQAAQRGCENWSCEWPTEPELGRVAHGIPNRSHRLKGLGNAIVPQVAEQLLRWMKEAA